MIKLFLFLSVTGLIISCNNQDQNTKSGGKSTKNDLVDCYRYANNNDTIVLKTIKVGDAITGILIYKLYQKEENEGTILGRMNGDLLVANYTFFSEGVQQGVRQVAFKRSGNDFIEGSGETEQKPDRVVFKDLGSLSFNNSIILSGIDCK
jgi:hypothetical protein